jgi:cytochrome c-type biogenesis protein CcsB
MKTLLNALASLKLAVILLVLLLVGLAAGTILESARGTEVAGRLVYYSWWFLTLQGAFAANVVASIAKHFPWGKPRAGFLTTHTAMIVILLGAAITYFFKIEGHVQLWEGEGTSEIESGHLPFVVKLEKFTIERYPGTMRPSNFRSEVTVVDPRTGPQRFGIWMNHPLEYGGYTFYQSSYQQDGGRSATVLSVSKDPGQAIVFFGYGLLLVGMCTVLATRIAAVRARDKRLSTPKELKKVTAIAAMLLLGFLAGPARAADADQARRQAVLHDGRVMPLDTLAREAVWNVTGQRSFNGRDPVDSVLFWSTEPQVAMDAPIVKIAPDIASVTRLPIGTTHASFGQLVNDRALMALLDQAREQEGAKQGVMASAQKLEERLLWMQRFFQHEAIKTVETADPAAIEREITYNAVRPTRVAWIVLGAALVLSIFAWNGKRKLLDGLSLAGLAIGFAVMTWGIATRWMLAGRIPAANMYESLLFLAWGVGLFAVLAFAIMRNRLVVLNANAMAFLTMALTDLLPIDGFIHPVPPVLAGTPWLAIHVPIIMVSYSVLALGVVIAHMQVGFTIFKPNDRQLIERMNDLLYWYIHVGSILLIAGILSGSVWAASSWGRYWGWDPKEVWSLVAFLAYVAILHARWDKQIARFGVAAWSIVAFQTILMTYLGVNFVLTTGMHSYGMGDSPVVTAMVAVALAEAAFLAWGWIKTRQHTSLAAA